MAQENLFPKILPTNNIAATIHPLYPTDKLTYIDHSIDSVRPCKIYPESSDISNGAPIEFVIHDCSELFLDLGSIKLEVSLWILDEDGERVGVDGGANVYFTNNLLSSLFPVVKVFINNTNVETQYFAHHIANLNHIKEISNALALNRGRASGVFAIEKEGVGPVITEGIQAANAARKAFSKKDLVYVKGYLNIDVASSNKWLVDGSTVRIVLDQSKANQLINSDSNDTSWKYEIKAVRLLANRIKPARGAFIDTSKYLQSHSMEYIFKQHIVHSQILPAHQTSLTITRPFNAKIPSLFHIFFVDQAAEQGSYTRDRLFYGTNNLAMYRVTINGRVLVEDEIQDGSDHISVYEDSREACRISETFIPTDLYTHGSFVMSIRTNDSQPGELMYEGSGNLAITINFKEAIQTAQLCFVVGEVHSSFEITPDRQCLTNSGY